MNARTVLCVLCVLCGVLFLAGCSIEQRQWADRGLAVEELNAANLAAIYSLADSAFEGRMEKALQTSIAEAVAAGSGKIVIDGKPVAADEAWIREHVAGTALLVKKILDARRELWDKHQLAQASIDDAKHAFRQVKRLNVFWAGQSEVLQSQFRELLAEVRSIREASGKKPRRRRRRRGGWSSEHRAEVERQVGLEWEAYRARHPSLAAAIEQEFDQPGPTVIVNRLAGDVDLEERTEAALRLPVGEIAAALRAIAGDVIRGLVI